MTPTDPQTVHDSAPASSAAAGYLSEMFCSVQGEGLFIGERQIFVRTAGCAATCSWCDTVYSKVQTPRFVVHDGAKTPWRPNPVSLDDLMADLTALARAHAPVTAVSLTGGEPLEQPEFSGAIARAARERGFRVHLETAGLHAAALRTMVGDVDAIAMDIKLPSATGVDTFDAHRAFLAAIRGTAFEPGRNPERSIFVKVIVDLEATVEEIDRAAALAAEADRRIPFVLQPESEILFSKKSSRADRSALMNRVDEGARAAMRRLDTVRVIPQTHRVLHVR